MNGELTIQEVVALLLGSLGANFEHGIALELNRLAATDADQVMVMLQGLIELVVLVIFGQI